MIVFHRFYTKAKIWRRLHNETDELQAELEKAKIRMSESRQKAESLYRKHCTFNGIKKTAGQNGNSGQ